MKVKNETGFYGVWSDVSKRFVFGIQAETKIEAKKALEHKIGKNSRQYRFRVKAIKDCPQHRPMFNQRLKTKEASQ